MEQYAFRNCQLNTKTENRIENPSLHSKIAIEKFFFFYQNSVLKFFYRNVFSK